MAKYTIEKKLEVITHFQENGLTSTIKKYNVSTIAIYSWLNKYERGNMMRKQTQCYTVEELDSYRNEAIDNLNINNKVVWNKEEARPYFIF